MTPRAAEFERQGLLVLEGVLNDFEVEALRDLCEPLFGGAARSRPGVRRVLERAPRVLDILATSRVGVLAAEFAVGGAAIVRSILFDKSADSNWLVPWHQDAVIAVRDQRDVVGFGPWSIKDGEVHCRPPRAILDSILVVRLHLDECGPDNGPLRVVVGSHMDGLLPDVIAVQAAERGGVKECCVGQGGAVLMRPHSVHASPRARIVGRRRVLHLEFSGAALPGGLEWAEFAPLASPL